MNQQLLQNVVAELQTNLTGRYLGKIFQLSPVSFAFDFGLRGEFLFVSVEPASPRMYLIRRRQRDLEKQSQQLNRFGQLIRDKLSGNKVIEIQKEPADRIVKLRFAASLLIAQLTGRTSDLFLLDESNQIEMALRTRIEGVYQMPPVREIRVENDLPPATGSPSEAADAYYSSLEQTREFDSRANAVRSKLLKSLRQKQKLKENLQKDLAGHGDPNEHKRIGDLLLANVATAKRHGNKVEITNYYAEGAPAIEIEIDQNVSLQDEAAQRFRQYGKAKRAREEIAERMVQIDREIAQLNRQVEEIEKILVEKDETALAPFIETKPPRKPQEKKQPSVTGVRRYLSSDGYEILVGRAARDNDNLTFKIAQPNDLWLHAGDYPGSHVVVRNPTRKEIPHRTIVEAAQLAGKFSQASEDTKVVIHYTPRKFLSKPKGAAPGLVRLSRFKSITVEPKEAIPRLNT
ncbi:MAG TPA: NFACT RNA binding domain-containing protein [Pyrinomonadaceae bacterium]|nr:NFACT RNA binding domain-containing protein [Pyrinomonadaceae bacterium]